MRPSFKICLDRRRIKKDGTYPVVLRVTYNRDPKRYRTGYALTENEFEHLWLDFESMKSNERKQLNCDYKKLGIIANVLRGIRQKAIDSENAIEDFDFPLFEKHFLGKTTKTPNDVFAGFDSYIKELNTTGSVTTAEMYGDSKKRLIRFLDHTGKKKKIRFGNITVDWLNSFEDWMRDPEVQNGKPKSWATIAIDVRNLRRIYNRAINTGSIKKTEMYPFGLDRYEIPGAVNTKRALTFDQVNMIFYYDCTGNNEKNNPYLANLDKMEFWRDIWVLSYLTGGANFKDIASWKWENYSSGKIEFIRQKTRRKTKSNLETITIQLDEFADTIIQNHGTKDRDPEYFIFPFYTNDMDEKKKLAVSKQQNKNLNKWIKRICKNLGFEENVSLMHARHSFATISMNRGIDTAYISKKLGHKDIKTTGAYLDSFENETDREYQRVLIDRDSSKYSDNGEDERKLKVV
jgi:integrase